ncbi:hypothetical protein PROFUN_03458 [Planoprotostelium fungivorum]|uniref:Uncharacterized protein n=1 Tax=Planoprotostelium fungivorum TaxID=1890364 RepID=A0A2P6MN55_9EUKA|nr:hypothetical protein PROFUN_03458 [Planoprotostelium fungivorum]
MTGSITPVSAAPSSFELAPGVIPGKIHKDNKGAIDWGQQGLVAYGSHLYVLIVDPQSLNIVQTLDAHQSPVTLCRWSKECLHNSLSRPYSIRLSSAEKTGSIIIWNVLEASVLHVLQEVGLNRPVVDMMWIENDPHSLISLYHPNTLILWNVETGQKIWRLDPTLSPVHLNLTNGVTVPNFGRDNTADSFKFLLGNPQNEKEVIVGSANGGIYVMHDYLTGDFVQTIPTPKADVAPPVGGLEYGYSICTTRSSDVQKMYGDILNIFFYPHQKDVICVVFPREIVMYDISIHQNIGSILMDRNKGNLMWTMAWQREDPMLITLHDDATLSAWVPKEGDPGRWECKHMSDIMRFGKQTRKKGVHITSVYNMPTDPHQRIVFTTSDGILWEWIYSDSQMESVTETVSRTPSLSFSLATMYTNFDSSSPNGNLKFRLIGCVDVISSPISSICTSPVSTASDANGTLLAVGTMQGTLQVVDMRTRRIIWEIYLWSHVVRGVRWVNRNTILLFGCEETGKEEFRNHLVTVDVRTKTTKDIRKMNAAEGTFIRGIRLSNAGQYVAVLLKDRPFEIWDLRSCNLIRTMKPFTAVTSLEWAPSPYTENGWSNSQAKRSQVMEDDNSYVREAFIFSMTDGAIKTFVVEANGHVASLDIMMDISANIISSIAWKDHLVVAGDTLGNLIIWNFKTKKATNISTGKGLVRKIKFSPSLFHHIVVLFNEEFGIWDLDHNVRLSMSNYLKQRDLKSIDVDWINETTCVSATNDGCLRIMDRSLTITNSPSYQGQLYCNVEGMSSVYMMECRDALNLKFLLQHLQLAEDKMFTYETTSEQIHLLLKMEERFVREILACKDLHQRCMWTAKLFGDSQELLLWRLLGGVLQDVDRITENVNKRREISEKRARSNTSPPIHITNESASTTNHFSIKSDRGYNVGFLEHLMGSQHLMHMEKIKSDIYDKKMAGSSYEFSRKVVDRDVLLGRKEAAKNTLLSTPVDNPNYLLDQMKAGLISASISPDSFQHTVRRIAHQLNQNGFVSQSVQMLSLIGLNFEACEYLQRDDRWEEAAWLAKMSLDEVECGIIYKSYARHLSADPRGKMRAVHILVSLGEFQHVLELLHELKMYDIAAPLVSILKDRGLLQEETKMDKEKMVNSLAMNTIPIQQLLNSIHLDYGYFLHAIGNQVAAEHYLMKAGSAGQNALEGFAASRKSKRTKMNFRGSLRFILKCLCIPTSFSATVCSRRDVSKRHSNSCDRSHAQYAAARRALSRQHQICNLYAILSIALLIAVNNAL